MDTLIHGTIRHRRSVLVIFIILTILCGFALTQVRINYDLADYLPHDVPSTQALHKMEDEYDMTIPNARVVVPIASVQDGLRMKQRLKATDGVTQVLWLDDTVDMTVPLAVQNPSTVETFYKEGKALYQVSTDTNMAAAILDEIYALHPEVEVDGDLVDLANAHTSTEAEMVKISIIIIPLALIVLLLTTHAWLEPLIFMVTILVGIALNMGTNIFLGDISFITQAIAAVLQLAVSMDYAIFLLNRFNENREAGYAPEDAMHLAMRKAVKAISSSALTTVFGFLALIFMQFRIGGDLGIVMAKGILLSFVSVMFFMPVLLLAVYRWVDKTTHRYLLPDFAVLGKVVLKARWALVALALILAVPGVLASRSTTFIYGMGEYPEGSRMREDRASIQATFGEQEQMVLMVPKGNIPKELTVQERLEEQPEIVSVVSYVNTVDPAIPVDVLGQDQVSMLISEHYSQFIITAEVPSEGDRSFALVETVREIGQASYPDSYYLAGQNVSMYDMKTTIQADDIVVNGLAILAIAIVIFVVFKSLTLPILLVLTIEIAIWVNLSIPYFANHSLSYIGYLIISTVQLGATVDYAILYTEHYLDNRQYFHKRHAIIRTSQETIPSLLTPAIILTLAGYSLRNVSSLAIVSELGGVLGRGAIFSLLMVVFVLPALLYLFDHVIQRTTKGLDLLQPHEPEVEDAAEILDDQFRELQAHEEGQS